MRILAALLTALYLLPVSADPQKVFKCVGPNGAVFQDHHCGSDGSATSLPGGSSPSGRIGTPSVKAPQDAPGAAVANDAGDTPQDALVTDDQRNYRMHVCMVDQRNASLRGTPDFECDPKTGQRKPRAAIADRP